MITILTIKVMKKAQSFCEILSCQSQLFFLSGFATRKEDHRSSGSSHLNAKHRQRSGKKAFPHREQNFLILTRLISLLIFF
jgi:hypothetical protein